MIWETWKKGFDTWEQKTAEMMESVLKSPAVLTPMGSLLTQSMKVKTATDKAIAGWWGAWGLPTRSDRTARAAR
jgi:hypothetical protein